MTEARRTSVPTRKRALQRLRLQEDQYRRIFEATTDGLVITDVETGAVLAANPAFCRMHGHEDMVGMSPEDFIPAASLHIFAEKDATVKAGREFRGRAEHIRRDGTIFPVEMLGTTFNYADRPAVLGLIRDISDQVRNEQAMDRVIQERTQELESLLSITQAVLRRLTSMSWCALSSSNFVR